MVNLASHADSVITNGQTELENAYRGASHERHFQHAHLHDSYGMGTFLRRIREPSEAEPEEEDLSDEDESMEGTDNNSSSKRVEVQLADKENINQQLTSKIDEDSDFSEDSDSSNGDDERMQVDGTSTMDSTSANKNAGKEMLNGVAGFSSSSGASSSSASASNTTTTTAESCQNKPIEIDAKKKHTASIMKSPSDEKKLVLPGTRKATFTFGRCCTVSLMRC